MPANPPPIHIARVVHQAAPGIWTAIVGSANAALAGRRVSVNSWFRTVRENASLRDASPDSQHLIGTALDVGGPDRSIVAADMQRAGWIRVAYRNHEHLQVWPAGVVRRSGLLRAAGV